MFTGLIADLGRVEAVEADAEGATLRIATALAAELGEGDSIAVNGVCLTAVDVVVGDPAARAREGARGGSGVERGEFAGVERGEFADAGRGEFADAGRGEFADAGRGEFAAQAMHETLQRSTLGALAAGDPVNLELALRADGRLGGHIVQGHIDGTGAIAEIRDEGFSRVLAIETDHSLGPYLVEKGSITVDGVSLTVSRLRNHGFEVSLIPETLQRTTLGRATVGQTVNLESDILARHVQRLLEAHT